MAVGRKSPILRRHGISHGNFHYSKPVRQAFSAVIILESYSGVSLTMYPLQSGRRQIAYQEL